MKKDLYIIILSFIAIAVYALLPTNVLISHGLQQTVAGLQTRHNTKYGWKSISDGSSAYIIYKSFFMTVNIYKVYN